MNKIILLLFSCLLFACKTTQVPVVAKEEPDTRPYWIKSRPVDAGKYIGIGLALKSRNREDFQLTAKKNALNDLASEIKVNISSNSLLMQMQSDNKYREDFESNIKMSAQENIEGFELIDTWNNGDEYWVYYSLSRAKYEEIKAGKLNKAKDDALALYKKGLDNYSAGNYMQAFQQKVYAFSILQPFLNENLEVDFNNKKIQLGNDLLESMQQQLATITITSNANNLQGKTGKNILKPIVIKLNDKTNKNAFLSGIPIKTSVTQGEMQLKSSFSTTEKGECDIFINKINSSLSTQQFKIELNIERMISIDSLNTVLKNILLKTLSSPINTINIDVTGVKLYINSVEKNMGTLLDINILAPALSGALSKKGFTMVNSIKEADYTVEIQAETMKGSAVTQNEDIVNSMLNVSLNIKQPKSNTSVFKDALVNIKGIQLNYEKAGMDAFKKAKEQLIDFRYINNIVNAIQN